MNSDRYFIILPFLTKEEAQCTLTDLNDQGWNGWIVQGNVTDELRYKSLAEKLSTKPWYHDLWC